MMSSGEAGSENSSTSSGKAGTKLNESPTPPRRRKSANKTSVKKSPPNSVDASNNPSSAADGFNPLRSLRNIFLGYRRRRRPVSEAVNVGRARSTEALDELGKRSDVTVPTKVSQHDRRRSHMPPSPYCKLMSASAGDLLGAEEWSGISTPPGGACSQSSIPPSCSSAENLDTASSVEGAKRSVSSMDENLSDSETSEFFREKWSEHVVLCNRPARLSEGDADLVVDDLNTIGTGHSLDVTVIKDRLAVKQKGKRQSAIYQQKIQTSLQEMGEGNSIQICVRTLPAVNESEEMESTPRDLERTKSTDDSKPVPGAHKQIATDNANEVDRPKHSGPVRPPRPVISNDLLAEAMRKVGAAARPTTNNTDENRNQLKSSDVISSPPVRPPRPARPLVRPEMVLRTTDNGAEDDVTPLNTHARCGRREDENQLNDAVKKPKPRPKTTYPIAGGTAPAEPEWLSAIAQKKKLSEKLSSPNK